MMCMKTAKGEYKQLFLTILIRLGQSVIYQKGHFQICCSMTAEIAICFSLSSAHSTNYLYLTYLLSFYFSFFQSYDRIHKKLATCRESLENKFIEMHVGQYYTSQVVFLFQTIRFSDKLRSFISTIFNMHSSVCIEIDNHDKTYVEATVIKARRRRAHICFALQQIGIFLFCCLCILTFTISGPFVKDVTYSNSSFISFVLIFRQTKFNTLLVKLW